MIPEQIERVFGRERLRIATGEHVEVFREAAAPGERRRYTKRFLATDDVDFRQWTAREWRILARLIGHGVRCVPDVVQFDGGAQGGMRQVQTYDAGITVDQWATLLPVARDGAVRRHVFEDCAHWWALAHHCLAALDAIHALELVHLDIKADNICIPCDPAHFDPAMANARLCTAFGKLALIDYAFSLVSRETLDIPLPLGWQKDYDYQSPRLLRALEAASAGDLQPTQELDWRCDLYSLAAMLRRYLPVEEWARSEGAAAGWTATRYDDARSLIYRLRECHDNELPRLRPHRQLMEVTAAQITDPEFATSLSRGWTLALDADTAATTALITPMTRIAAPRVLPDRTVSPLAPPTAVTEVPAVFRQTRVRVFAPASVVATRRAAAPPRIRAARITLLVVPVVAVALLANASWVAEGARFVAREVQGFAADLRATLDTGRVAPGAARSALASAPSPALGGGPTASAAESGAGTAPDGGAEIVAPAAVIAETRSEVAPSQPENVHHQPEVASSQAALANGPAETAPAEPMPARAEAVPALANAQVAHTVPELAASTSETTVTAEAQQGDDSPPPTAQASAPTDARTTAVVEAQPAVQPASKPAARAPTPAPAGNPRSASGARARAPSVARDAATSAAPQKQPRRLALASAATPRGSRNTSAPARPVARSVQAAAATRASPSVPIAADATLVTPTPPAADPSAAAASARTSVQDASTPSGTESAVPGRPPVQGPVPSAPALHPNGGATATASADSAVRATAGDRAVGGLAESSGHPASSSTSSAVVRTTRPSPQDAWRAGLRDFMAALGVGLQRAAPVEERSVQTPRSHVESSTARVFPAQVAPAPAARPERIEPAPPTVAYADAPVAAPRALPSEAPRAEAPTDRWIVSAPRIAPAASVALHASSSRDAQEELRAEGKRMVAEVVPRVAAQAQSDVSALLRMAAATADASQERAIANAAYGRWPSERTYFPAATVSAPARQLHAEAKRKFALGQDAEAVDLELRAFAANPRDPDIAGFLAFLHLRLRPAQPETARQLALHALASSGSARAQRLEDWNTFAVASALSGREVDAARAFLVALALTPDVERSCRAAIGAYAMFGERLRAPVQALLYRVRAQGRDYDSASCAWPVYRTAATWQ